MILHLETKDRVDSLSCTVDVTVQTGWTTGQRCEGSCCAHGNSWWCSFCELETGSPPGRCHFFSSEHRSAGFSFRVLGWVCSPTRDAFSDFLDGPCAAPCLPWEPSLLLFSFSLRFTVNYLQAVQTLVPFLSPKVRGRKVRFLFPQASA